MDWGQKNKYGKIVKRYAFPDSGFFFSMPRDLIDKGILPTLSGGEFRRLVTLYHESNFRNGSSVLRLSFAEMNKKDGLSNRRARDVIIGLEEKGLIQVDKKTRPYTYTLVDPVSWPEKTFSSNELNSGTPGAVPIAETWDEMFPSRRSQRETQT